MLGICVLVGVGRRCRLGCLLPAVLTSSAAYAYLCLLTSSAAYAY